MGRRAGGRLLPALRPDGSSVSDAGEHPAVVHICRRIFLRGFLIKANANTRRIVKVSVTVSDLGTAGKDFHFRFVKSGKFLDAEIVDMEIQMHLGCPMLCGHRRLRRSLPAYVPGSGRQYRLNGRG